MFRQDASKMLMKNPATASARIYVGNLNENVVSTDIETHFSKYGKILGVLIHRGFGFIQFETEEMANEAIKSEHQSFFHGRNLVVRRAQSNASFAGNGSNVQNNPMRASGPPDTSPMNRISNDASRGRGRGIGSTTTYIDIGRTAHRGIAPMGRGGRGINLDRDRSPLDRRDGYDMDSSNVGNNPVIKRPDDRNDCEIIVVSKALTKYAEFIEDKLKQLGITVDLLFPNEDVPIGRVLSNIASRGCLYAILVVPQSEEHKSLTLNILHGMQQEHRHMPLIDAMTLIKNDFESYCRGDKQPIPQAVKKSYAHIPLAKDRHPDRIQTLISILAENRTLTVLQYDRLIRYLQDRRENQVKIELGDTDVPMESAQTKTQQELQQRILSILNKPTEPSVKSTIPDVSVTPQWSSPQAPASSKTGSTPLLHDPTVQKALDSLLQGVYPFIEYPWSCIGGSLFDGYSNQCR